jgi:hypothetical protein
MPQILLTGQLKEKPTYRVWCLYSSFVHEGTIQSPGLLPLYACKGWFNLIVCADAVYSLTHISAMTCRGGLGK